MISPQELHALKAQLFCLERANVFAVLDGATVPELPATLATFRPEYRCLYRGELPPDMAEVAPYLVVLERDAPFTDWLLANGWGRNWGIFGVSREDIRVLNRHLRRFVRVDQGERWMYFRYYDPVVLRNYLPTCTGEDLKAFFGPVLVYVTADEDTRFTRTFAVEQNVLRQRVLLLSELSSVYADPFSDLFAKVEATAGTGRLMVRPEQTRKTGESIYVERMRDYLNECFPESKEIPREEMKQTILQLTTRAAGYKLILETHVAPFIVAAWVFGASFDEDFKTVKAVLEDYEMDTGRKAQWLWDFIEETVGILEDGLQERP